MAKNAKISKMAKNLAIKKVIQQQQKQSLTVEFHD